MINSFYKIIIFTVILVSCSNSNIDNNIKNDKTKKNVNSKDAQITNIQFEVNNLPFGIVDIHENNYINIDNKIIESINGYKTLTNTIINIRGNQYYVSSIYTIDIENESFAEQIEKEHYVYISLWKLNDDKANFIAGFYPFTMYSYEIEYIKPYITNDMLEVEILRHSRKYEYIDLYKFRIKENNNILSFYLTNFTEKTTEYNYETGNTETAEYSFDKNNIIMNDLVKNYEY